MVRQDGPASVGKPAYREIELDMSVISREEVSDGVVAVTLAKSDGGELPAWSAGAHVDLVMTPSLTRQYSLCGGTADRTQWRVGVLRDPNSRGGSQFVHDKLHEGTTVRVRGPRNHFALVSAPRYQFIAGGIGITPILTMIEEAVARGSDWNLLYGGRTRASMAFHDELAQYGDRVTVWPQDERGMLDLKSVLGTPRALTLVYCCGPEGLLGAVEVACAGWPGDSLHIERFAAKAATESADALDSFEVECQRSGVTVTVPKGKSIYKAVEEVGVDVLASCMVGVCGTCESEVIKGEPEHLDSVLTETDREAGLMMICVSRSRSAKLVLDL